MSEVYLPEICDSNFDHHKMIEVDKVYYQRQDGKILCGECIEPWIQEQSEKILNRMKPWFLRGLEYRDNGYLSSDQKVNFTGTVSIVEYMVPVLGDHMDVEFTMTEADPIRVILMSYGVDFRTEFSVDLGDDDQWTNTVEENFLTKLEETLRLFIYGTFDRMSSEAVEIIIETLERAYESISSSAGTNCESECPDIPEIFGECCVCGKGLVKPYYVYFNQPYCVDDMYSIVVKLAIKSNLSEYVGIAQPDEPPLPSNPIPYQDTREWRMGVIDKYFNYMEEYTGSAPGYRVN